MIKSVKQIILTTSALVFLGAAAFGVWYAARQAPSPPASSAAHLSPLTWDEAERLILDRQSGDRFNLPDRSIPLVRAGEADYFGIRCYLFYRVLSDAPVFIENDFLDPTQSTTSHPFAQSLPDVEHPDGETPPDYATHKYYVGVYGDKFVEVALEPSTNPQPVEAGAANPC